MTARVGDYLLLETLGEGAFGKVRHAVHHVTGAHYAVKVMDKSLIRHHSLTVNVRREIAIMRALSHPNIVALHHVLSSPTNLYVVLEFVRGSELFQLIANTPRGLPEPAARRYFQQLVDGVLYCHRRGVSHRDLKPENLLIDSESGILKITDFGLSSMKGADTTTDLLTTQCGTPHYIAPEIISRVNPAYDGQKVDTWACGIILFALLAGYLPFDETDLVCLFDTIREGHVHFPPWFSSAAKDLLWRLLCVDPETRISLADVVNHPWFAVDYQPLQNPSPGLSSSPKHKPHPARRPRKRKQKRSSNRARAQNRNTPKAPLLTLQLPDLQLPDPSQIRPPLLSNASTTAAAAARNEMMRSGRAMSFSKRYSLIRKGIVTYGPMQPPYLCNEPLPASLGGIEQARMRGVVSTTGSVFSASRATIFSEDPSDTVSQSAHGATASSSENPSGEVQTVGAIRSLRVTISMCRTASKWYEFSRNLASPTREALLQKSTLISLKRLRNQLVECAQNEQYDECQQSAGKKCYMSSSQRREMLRLLDVWETRIIRDASPLSKDQAQSTGLSGEELQSFQTLLQTWETQLAGEEIVEDVLIPGSEMVEDEVPNVHVPSHFMEQRNVLNTKANPPHEKVTSVDALDALNAETSLAFGGYRTSSEQPVPSPQAQSPVLKLFPSPVTANKAKQVHSEEGCQDLNLLWNHVLVANTSKMGEMLESDADSISSLEQTAPKKASTNSVTKDVTFSPVTEWRSLESSGMLEHSRGNDIEAGYPRSSTPKKRQRERKTRSNLHTSQHPRRCSSTDDSSSRPEQARTSHMTSSFDSQRTSQGWIYQSPRTSAEKKRDSELGKNSFRTVKFSSDRHRTTGNRESLTRLEGSENKHDQGAQHQVIPCVSIESLDEDEPRLVRSFGQRRIQTDLTPELNPLKVLDTPSGFTALANRIRGRGRRQTRARATMGHSTLAHETDNAKLVFSESRANARCSKGLLAGWFGVRKFDARFESRYNARTCIRELNRVMKQRGFSVARKPGENRLRVAVAGSDGRFVTVTFDFATKGSGCIVRFQKTGGEKFSSRNLEENLVWSFYDEVVDAFRDSNEGVAVVNGDLV